MDIFRGPGINVGSVFPVVFFPQQSLKVSLINVTGSWPKLPALEGKTFIEAAINGRLAFLFFGDQPQGHVQIYLNREARHPQQQRLICRDFIIFLGDQTEALADFGLHIDGKFPQQVQILIFHHFCSCFDSGNSPFSFCTQRTFDTFKFPQF